MPGVTVIGCAFEEFFFIYRNVLCAQWAHCIFLLIRHSQAAMTRYHSFGSCLVLGNAEKCVSVKFVHVTVNLWPVQLAVHRIRGDGGSS
jgi:hypothetical protein